MVATQNTPADPAHDPDRLATICQAERKVKAEKRSEVSIILLRLLWCRVIECFYLDELLFADFNTPLLAYTTKRNDGDIL